jgi:hypothetical protein
MLELVVYVVATVFQGKILVEIKCFIQFYIWAVTTLSL